MFVASRYYIISLTDSSDFPFVDSFVSYFMQLVDNDTVSVPSYKETMAEQPMISCSSSYPGCLRCFNHRRITERYGSRIRDVSTLILHSLSPHSVLQ